MAGRVSGIRSGNRLDARGGLRYIQASFAVGSKGQLERAMRYLGYFAFTYRFSFGGKRTGETRAGNQRK